jgi:acyl-CoA synthetase (AMP-forming)/AMP-acid ligase II
VNIALLLEMAADAMGDRRAVGNMTYPELQAAASQRAEEVGAAGETSLVTVDVNSPAIPIGLFGAAIAGVPFVPLSYRLTDAEIADRKATLAATEVPDDTAVLLFTSGTTGPPKAAVLCHEHLSAYVIGTVEFMGAEEDEATLVSVPPYHVAGVSAVLSSVYAGRRIVYLPQFDPVAWVEAARAEAITHAMVVPTMLGRILDVLDADGKGLPSLRHLSYGGGRMPVAVIERAMEQLSGCGFVNAYGLTETSSTIAVLTPDDHREAFASDDPAVRARLGSVGQPLPTLEVEIRDGEVWVRGEQVSGQYLGASSVLTDDGWFRTRDAGRLDDAGYLFVEGRLDDVIVRGAENLSPGEIEDVLQQHPAVAEAAVVGVPSEEWGEAVAAAVVLTSDGGASEAELQDWVRERLRSARTPERIEFRSELPYNETGKLLRRVLREELSTPTGSPTSP